MSSNIPTFISSITTITMNNAINTSKIDQLSTLDAAQRWANNCKKLHVVMLGDNGKYWVVSFAYAQQLCKIGYEIA